MAAEPSISGADQRLLYQSMSELVPANSISKFLDQPVTKRLFKHVQPQDNYQWAMSTLANAKQMDPLVLTKSGIMVGLGETFDEVVEVMRDLSDHNVDILTIGQYLQPSKKHLPIKRYYHPDEFVELKRIGLEQLGFKWVESAPLVRSSFRAGQQARQLSKLGYVRQSVN